MAVWLQVNVRSNLELPTGTHLSSHVAVLQIKNQASLESVVTAAIFLSIAL